MTEIQALNYAIKQNKNNPLIKNRLKIKSLAAQAETNNEHYKTLQTISPTEVNTYTRCARQHHYKYDLKLRNPYKSKNLLIGILVDEWMNKYHNPSWWSETYLLDDPTQSYIKQESDKHMQEWAELYLIETNLSYTQLVELDQCQETAQRMVNDYADKHPFDRTERTLVTQTSIYASLAINSDREKSSKPFAFGYIDRIIEKDGKFYLVDVKTTSKITDSFIRKHRIGIQLRLYKWILQRNDIKIDGIILDCLARDTATPRQPRLLKNGKKLEKFLDKHGKPRFATTTELFMAAIQEHDLDENDYTQEIDYLSFMETEDSPGLARIILEIDDESLQQTIKDFRIVSNQITSNNKHSLPNPSDQNCSMCDYRSVCESSPHNIKTEWTEHLA